MSCLILFDRLGDLEFPLRYQLQKLAIDLQLLFVDIFAVSFLLFDLISNFIYVSIAIAISFPHKV